MADPGAAEAHFVIDGRDYEIPSLETFTMGEAVTLYEYSGLTLDQIDEDTPAHPGLIAAFMHIAYERGNPGVKKQKVRDLIEQSNLLDAMQNFFTAPAGEDDADPPAVAETVNGSGSSGTPSGTASTNGSAEPGTLDVVTGMRASAASVSTIPT